MLARQTNLLKSPLSSAINQASPLMNFNSSSSGSMNSAGGLNTSNLGVNAAPSTAIDEKSIKDIIQIVNKCIDKTKNLTEFSQILQVDSIGKCIVY
jgi:hypothetical protein